MPKANGKDALIKETNHVQGRCHVKSGNALYIFVYEPNPGLAERCTRTVRLGCGVSQR